MLQQYQQTLCFWTLLDSSSCPSSSLFNMLPWQYGAGWWFLKAVADNWLFSFCCSTMLCLEIKMKRPLTPLSNLVDNGIQGTQKDSLKKAVVVEPNFKVGRQKKKKKTCYRLFKFSAFMAFWNILLHFAKKSKQYKSICLAFYNGVIAGEVIVVHYTGSSTTDEDVLYLQVPLPFTGRLGHCHFFNGFLHCITVLCVRACVCVCAWEREWEKEDHFI